MNEYQYLNRLKQVSGPSLDDKVKSSLPGAVFGGTLGGAAGSIIGSSLDQPGLGLAFGTGAGTYIGAKRGLKNVKMNKGYLATNAEALGAGVAGTGIGTGIGHIVATPTHHLRGALSKHGSDNRTGLLNSSKSFGKALFNNNKGAIKNFSNTQMKRNIKPSFKKFTDAVKNNKGLAAVGGAGLYAAGKRSGKKNSRRY